MHLKFLSPVANNTYLMVMIERELAILIPFECFKISNMIFVLIFVQIPNSLSGIIFLHKHNILVILSGLNNHVEWYWHSLAIATAVFISPVTIWTMIPACLHLLSEYLFSAILIPAKPKIIRFTSLKGRFCPFSVIFQINQIMFYEAAVNWLRLNCNKLFVINIDVLSSPFFPTYFATAKQNQGAPL